MGYKEDIEIKKNYEEYGESLASEEGDNKKYIKELQYIFGRETVNELPLHELKRILQIIAQKEYADIIISHKAKLAQNYEGIVAQTFAIPKVSTFIDRENKLAEIEGKTKLIKTMNSIVNFVNFVHDRSKPLSSKRANDVITDKAVSLDGPKRLYKREGMKYVLDDEDYMFLTNYEEENIIGLNAGNVALAVSSSLIDMQFGEKEGIVFSKDSENIKYYKLPDTKENLLQSMNYEVKPEWYTRDLTDELIEKNDDIIEIISASVNYIEDENLRENILQDFNYLLARARLNTITHIPDSRNIEIQQLSGRLEAIQKKAIDYYNRNENIKTELENDNEKLRKKCDKLQVDSILEENRNLKKENSELQENLQTERDVWSRIPFLGKIIERQIKKKKLLLGGIAPSDAEEAVSPGDSEGPSSPDGFENLKVSINYSKLNQNLTPEKEQPEELQNNKL